jgi:hypothetical protein
MERQRLAGVDEDGNDVTLFSTRHTQTVETTNGKIEYRERPHIYGPDGDMLVDDGQGGFRSPLGKLYRLKK